MRAWNSDARLRSAVLQQLGEHERIAKLDPVVIDGRALELYGWRQPSDLDALEHALGLPAPLLVLGLELFQGFPDSDLGTREHVRGVRTWLETASIGQDLTGVVPSFIAFRLTDTRFWCLCGDEIEDMLVRVAMAVLEGQPMEALADEVRVVQGHRNVIARDASQNIDVRRRACEECWALELAHAACVYGRRTVRVAALASSHGDTMGLPPTDLATGRAAKRQEWMRAMLVSLMTAAGS